MVKLREKHRISQLLEKKSRGVLSIYYTAGYPKRDDTLDIAKYLEKFGADLIEIGMPYSDPVADGPTIQASNQKALTNGMSVKLLMEQLIPLRQKVNLPVILMGYINPILQFGLERFCAHCEDRGIDALIIPDLPMQEYLDRYQLLFRKHKLHNIFLVTPQTTEDRIRWIDQHTESFIYAVSDASITGARREISDRQITYFERLKSMKLRHPFLIGFGISDRSTFELSCKYAEGAIIGSAFINVIRDAQELEPAIQRFIQSIRRK